MDSLCFICVSRYRGVLQDTPDASAACGGSLYICSSCGEYSRTSAGFPRAGALIQPAAPAPRFACVRLTSMTITRLWRCDCRRPRGRKTFMLKPFRLKAQTKLEKQAEGSPSWSGVWGTSWWTSILYLQGLVHPRRLCVCFFFKHYSQNSFKVRISASAAPRPRSCCCWER